MQQMRYLQMKNESLERTLEEERKEKEVIASAARANMEPSLSPEQRRKTSLIPLDEHTPAPSTPMQSSVKKSCNSRSGRRYSLISSIDLGSTGRRGSTASRAAGGRRLSVAHEALSAMHEESERTHRLGDAPAGSGDIRTQRRWWAEQRQILLEDLYPRGSSHCASSTGRARRTGGTGTERPMRNSIAVMGGGYDQARGSAEPTSAPATSGALAGREVRNLATTFEHIEDGTPTVGVAGGGEQPPAGAEPAGHEQRQAACAPRDSERQESKLKQPQFFWNKRRSVSCAEGASEFE